MTSCCRRSGAPPCGVCPGDREPPGGRRGAAANRLAQLAHHWTAAHDRPVPCAPIAAGDASRVIFAFAEAARQYERAIEAWTVPPEDRPTDRDLGDLYDAASAAATFVGDGSRAVELAQRAIELVDSAPGSEQRPRGDGARARERLGFASWLAGDTATSIRAPRGGGRPVRGDAASVRPGPRACRSGREPHAGRPVERLGAVRRAAIESARAVGAPPSRRGRSTSSAWTWRRSATSPAASSCCASPSCSRARRGTRPRSRAPRQPRHRPRDGRLRGGGARDPRRARRIAPVRHRARLRDLPGSTRRRC